MKTSQDTRLSKAKKNAIGSILLKGVSIVASFALVPITIDFVNPTQYGIWLTISSLLSWFNFFDIGLTLGFRNHFTESVALNKIKEARIYVSTTYVALLMVIGSAVLVFVPISYIVNWNDFLHISITEIGNDQVLSKIIAIMIILVGAKMILQVISTLLVADQKVAMSSFIYVLGQVSSVLIIYIMTLFVKEGSLFILTYIICGVPVLVLLVFTILFFKSRYRVYAPSLKYVRLNYIKRIMGTGGQFFIITTSMLFIFQIINIIISRVMGPLEVTKYNLAYKYFNIVFMVLTLIMNPLWSAFTDAYARRDFSWMLNVLKKLEKLSLLIIPIMIILCLMSNIFMKFWVGSDIQISTNTIIAVSIYVAATSYANIYMYLINGTGKVRMQLIIYLAFAVVAYPSMTFFCEKWGIPGLLTIPTLVYVFQTIMGRLQIYKLIKNKALGIWSK